MRVFASVSAFAATALFFVSVADAGDTTWAVKADQVCTVWSAKATKVLGNRQVNTAKQAYSYSVKAVGLEKQQLAALKKIGSPPPAAQKAMRVAQADIAEITTAIQDWKAGKRAAFTKVFLKWANDTRANKAFAAAGAASCG